MRSQAGPYKHVRRRVTIVLQHLKLPCPDEERGEEFAALRPHSGCAALITQLMWEGMRRALSMKFARHAPGSIKVHLWYGRLTLEDVKAACDKIEQPTQKNRCLNRQS